MSARPYANKTDEWYTQLSTVKIMYDLLEAKPNSTIICPFDTDASWFVKHGLSMNQNNILYGMTDWLENDYEYDYLITNPPFSLKNEVIEKCLKSGKPSVLVLPIDSLGGKARHQMYKTYGFPTTLIPAKRIAYINEQGQVKGASSFHSIIMLLNDPKGSRLLWE